MLIAIAHLRSNSSEHVFLWPGAHGTWVWVTVQVMQGCSEAVCGLIVWWDGGVARHTRALNAQVHPAFLTHTNPGTHNNNMKSTLQRDYKKRQTNVLKIMPCIVCLVEELRCYWYVHATKDTVNNWHAFIEDEEKVRHSFLLQHLRQFSSSKIAIDLRRRKNNCTKH